MRIVFGTDLIGMKADDFKAQLPEGWIHTGSEEGWARFLHWKSGRAVQLWEDQDGLITRYYWER